MSDTTNRQAYVFLQDGDTIQDGDEYYSLATSQWKNAVCVGQSYKYKVYFTMRRPITLPTEQTEKLTVWDEYAKIYFKYSIEKGFGKTVTAKDAKEYADEMMKARSMK